MLAHVQGRQVEPEGERPALQSLDGEQARMPAMIGLEARHDELEVAHELVRRLVVVGPAFVGGPEPLGHLREEDAVRHAIVPRRGGLARLRQQDVVLGDPRLQLAAGGHPSGALRELVGERPALLEVGRDHALLLAHERLADRLRVHLGIAVHVAAHPAAEAQDERHARELRRQAEHGLHPERDFLVERRDHAVDDLRQVEERVLALVGDRQAFARMGLGLPARRDLHADALPERAALEGRQRRVQPLDHHVGDLLVLAQDRAPHGLGRVRGEDRVDRDAGEQLQHLLRVVTGALQLVHAVADAARLRPVVAQQVFAPAADAMHALGEVDDLEPRAEGADQVSRLSRLAARGARDEQGRAVRLALAAPDRGQPVALDRVEQPLAALVAQHLADQPAEGVHVLAECRVLLGKLQVVPVDHAVPRGRGSVMVAARPVHVPVCDFLVRRLAHLGNLDREVQGPSRERMIAVDGHEVPSRPS